MNLVKACQATLGVSRSGYHAHLRKHERPRRRQDAQLTIEIRAAFTASRSTYGSPRLMHALRAKRLRHGNNRIARLMREQHLRVRQKRRFVPRTTTIADKTAAAAPQPPPAMQLHHSDRGCQYTSAEFQQRLKLRGITASMSRTANCYDNATM